MRSTRTAAGQRPDLSARTSRLFVKYRPFLAPLATGILFIFCFPKWNAGGWLAWVAFVPFLLAAPRLTWRGAAVAGAVAGLAANLGVFYWIYPTCRWGGVGLVPSLLAVVLLSAYLSLYWGAFGAAAWASGRLAPWFRPFFLAAAWVLGEFIRTYLLTGFPWAMLGNSQWLVPKHLPLAEIGGVYAVSFLLMLFNGTTALIFSKDKRWHEVLPGAAALVLLTVWSVSIWRRTAPPVGPSVSVAIVQGNIDQYKKWDAAYEEEVVKSYHDLTRRAAAGNPDLIIWPETAVPGWYPNDEKYRLWVNGLAKDLRIPLLIGAVTRVAGKDHNAAFLISAAGQPIGHYAKSHLVPFGEYVPLRAILGRFIGSLNALGTFDPGPGPRPIKGPAKLGVTICFEGLFPAMVRALVIDGAEILVNLTNDGWYRDTAGPEQHLAATTVRAVEARRWLLRAANTGYSAVISPRGEIAHRSALLRPEILSASIEPGEGKTFYARRGDVFAWACLGLVLLAAGCLKKKKDVGR